MDYRDVDICERIKDVMHEMSLGQKDLSSKTGVVQSSISAILSGKRSPSPLVKAMSDKMGINKEWLVNGVGLKYESSENIASDSNDVAKFQNISQDERIGLIKEMNALYKKHQSLLDEASSIMKTIVEINKKILISNC